MKIKAQSDQITQMAVDQAVILNKITNVEKNVDEIQRKLDSEYATKEWCESKYGQPSKLVYGIITIFGTALALALASFILRGGLK